MALGNLPINWAGVGLLVFGVGLMAAEVFVPGFGILGIGGVAAFIVGGLILFSPFEPSSPTMPDMQVSLWVIVPITATLAGMFFMIFQGAWDSRKLKPAMVINNMIGRRGYATTDLSPMGTVQLPGELWSAKPVDQEYIQAGDSVEVVELEGAILKVRKVREP
jgi:membrane-bound serine protease (ClpP class)